jgi:threonine dehydratase
VSNAPPIAEITSLRDRLGDRIVRTPLLRCGALEDLAGSGTTIYAKLEVLQHTGTFKARGALAVISDLTPEQLTAGVTAVSAGNHAIATAYAAKAVGTSAKIVMLGTASPARMEACRAFGAELVLTDDIHQAFDMAENIQKKEGRVFVHPFEGPGVATGTGTIGLEICEQCEQFDAVVVPIGGGGLIGGISNAVKQLRPDSEIVGVEPTGADTMHRSFAAGRPESIERVSTIADSLGAPFALPYSFELCKSNVDKLVRVEDEELRKSMGLMFEKMKFAVEPACAAATAALFGPLRETMSGKTVVLIFCGSNIDWETYADQAIFEHGYVA